MAISQSLSIVMFLRCSFAEAKQSLVSDSRCLTTIFNPELFFDSLLSST